MIGWASQWTQTPSSTSLQPKKWNAHFSIMFTSNDQPGLSMDLNPIHHLSPAKKWNAHILIMFNFWWLAGLVNGLKPHPPPLSSWKHEMLVFVLHSTSDVGQAAQWTQTPSATLFRQKNEMLIFGLHSTSDDWPAGWWTQTPSTTPLQSKNEILIFGLRSTSDNQPGWSMDSSPICHPSLAKKMKCSFLDYVQLLIIGQAGRWTQTPYATPLQLIKWNPHFWNTFNFWWSAWLVNGLEPHLPALSSHKNEMLLFGLRSTSDDRLGWLMDSNPICQPSPAKKMKCSYFDYVHFRWSARLVNGLKPHLPPLSSQKSEMLIFVLQSTSDLGQTGQWTQTPSTTRLQPIKWNAWFWITLNFWWLAGLVVGLEPHQPPLSSQKMKSSFLDFVQLLMISRAVRWTQTPSATPLLPKKWNAHFWIMFNFWWLAGLVDGLEPPLPPLSTQKYEMLVFV